MFSILDVQIDSSSKEAALSVYPRIRIYDNRWMVFHGDIRHVKPDAVVDESVFDVQLGNEEGQTPAATFLAQMQAKMTSDLSAQPALLMNDLCADLVVLTFFPETETQE